MGENDRYLLDCWRKQHRTEGGACTLVGAELGLRSSSSILLQGWKSVVQMLIRSPDCSRWIVGRWIEVLVEELHGFRFPSIVVVAAAAAAVVVVKNYIANYTLLEVDSVVMVYCSGDAEDEGRPLQDGDRELFEDPCEKFGDLIIIQRR